VNTFTILTFAVVAMANVAGTAGTADAVVAITNAFKKIDFLKLSIGGKFPVSQR
jgi:hypothetical protein